MVMEVLCCALLLAVGEESKAAPTATPAQLEAEQVSACRDGVCGSHHTLGDAAAADEEDSSCPCCKKCKCEGECDGTACECKKDCPTVDAAVTPATAVTAEIPAASESQRLLQAKLAERDRLQREIDELCEATKSWQQVVVRVKVLEVNLTKMRKLGIDFQQAGNVVTGFCSGGECGAPASTAYTAPTETASATTHTPCGTGRCEKSATSFWETLEQNNLAKVLADPTIVTVSGRPASLHVGGEIPIPAGKGSANSCNYVQFGTKLDVLASSLGDNRVRLEIRPRISELRDEGALVVDGQKIPSLNVTQCDSACELAFGETAALSGLVQRRTESIKTETGVREETQDVMLMVLVTPEAVTPAETRTAAAERMLR